MKQFNKQILEAINRGIKLALDNFDDDTPIAQSISKVKSRDLTSEYLEYLSQFVDLGLPSGTLWCKYNLGVNPNKLDEEGDWYGDYYAWGETITKNEYTDANYKYSHEYEGSIMYMKGAQVYTKYNRSDSKDKLDLEDDAAYMNNHSKGFRNIYTPTKDQFDELLQYTEHDKEHQQVKDYLGVRGLNGRIFKSKINDKEIFFPYSGIKGIDGELQNASHKGTYITSNISPYYYEHMEYVLKVEDTGYCSVDTIVRRFGVPIRPVMKK